MCKRKQTEVLLGFAVIRLKEALSILKQIVNCLSFVSLETLSPRSTGPGPDCQGSPSLKGERAWGKDRRARDSSVPSAFLRR